MLGTCMSAYVEIDYGDLVPPFSDPITVYSLTEGSFVLGSRLVNTGIRPLAILIIGPLAAGIAVGVPFHCFGDGPSQTLAAALFGAAMMLPLFAGVAWAVSPTNCPTDIARVFRRISRLSQVLRAVTIIGLLFIFGCKLLDLDQLLVPVGGWLLVATAPAVLLSIWGVIVVDEWRKRLRDLAP